MKNSIISAIFIASTLAPGLASASDFQGLSSENKQELLWDEVEATEWPLLPELSGGGWGSIISSFKAIFDLAKTFDHEGDFIPTGRTKIIHTYGAVAKVRYVPTSHHPYTGIFAEGGLGLVRFSLAGNPSQLGFTPGLGLKIFVDEQPSLNLVAMDSTSGQGENQNFFAKSFLTHINSADGFLTKIVQFIFSLTESNPNQLPVDHFAKVTADGHKVANPVVPEVLEFEAPDDIRTLIAEDSSVDFRTNLAEIPTGVLYHVYAKASRTSTSRQYIGDLVSESPFVASYFGDKVLFFQHRRK